MNSGDDEVSPERAELLRNLLAKPDLEYCHENFPATVSIILTRRTRAVVRVRDTFIAFHLENDDHGMSLLTFNPYRKKMIWSDHPALWRLACHVAAEAMLALRNGHKESVRVKKRKKQNAQRSKADISS